MTGAAIAFLLSRRERGNDRCRDCFSHSPRESGLSGAAIAFPTLPERVDYPVPQLLFPLSLRERVGVRVLRSENFGEFINVAGIVNERLCHRAAAIGVQFHFAQFAHAGFLFGGAAFDQIVR
jgi:hypothetical protein